MWVFGILPKKKSGYSQEEVNEIFEIQEYLKAAPGKELELELLK